MKKFILGIGIILVIALLLLLAYLLAKPTSQSKISLTPPTSTQSPKTITIIATTTILPESDGDLIKKALFSKNNWLDDGSRTFTVNIEEGKYASGGVSAQGGGGYFFAAKVNGQWEIVADGNGVILCSSLTKYPDFPKTLIPECFDDQTKKPVKR